MKPEANAVLEQAKQTLAVANHVTQGTAPDFKTMSIMEATKWCLRNNIDKPKAIQSLTGKSVGSIYTAIWKIKHPKRSKKLNRLSRERIKANKLVLSIKKAKPTTTQKPKIENGLYEDGMETPFLDAINRKTQRFNFLDEERQPLHELMAENRRLKILVDHYESLLFKGGK